MQTSDRAIAASPGAFRVLTVEDHPFVSEWMSARLEEASIDHVGNLRTPDGLVAAVEERSVDLVVVDVSIPGADPFSAVDDLRRVNCSTHVAFLSASINRSAIESAMRVGACGYFSKLDDPDEIVAGLCRIVSGRLAFGTAVQEAWPELSRIDGAPHSAGASFELVPTTGIGELTCREREVLRYYGLGMSRQSIARALHRSPKTIDKHRASMMTKLGIHDRVQLALYAIREGLVDPTQIPRGEEADAGP